MTFKLWRFELHLDWKPPVQPQRPYVVRYWGVSFEAMFFGSVTAFAEKATR